MNNLNIQILKNDTSTTISYNEQTGSKNKNIRVGFDNDAAAKAISDNKGDVIKGLQTYIDAEFNKEE